MKKVIYVTLTVLMILSVLVLSLNCQSLGGDKEWKPGLKPASLTCTNWPVDTSAYVAQNHMSGIISEKAGVEIRIVPLGNSLARHALVADGTADFALNDPSGAFYFYGLSEAANMDWGPQPIRRLIFAIDEPTRDSMFTSDPANIKSTTDLKGKKIGWIEGTFTYNFETLSYLATGGVYLDDVTVIPYPSFPTLLDGFLRKEIDVMRCGNPSPATIKIEASPLGAHIVPLPADAKAVENLRKHDPLGVNWITMYASDGGFGILPDGNKIGKDNPCPSIGRFTTITCYAQTDKNTAYWILKLHSEYYDEFMVNPPLDGVLTEGVGLERQLNPNTPDMVPWHEGAIEYLKEIGVWTEEMENHNQMLLQREKDLQELWPEVVIEAKEQGVSGKAFEEMWTAEVDKLLVSWGLK